MNLFLKGSHMPMDIIETRSKIQDVLFDTNRGFAFIKSNQIQSFLDRIETKFNILINDPHWDTTKMFVSKYPDLLIYKNIFLEFLNDLLQIDFVKYVYERSDLKSFEVPSSLGSPLALRGKTDNLFSDYEFEKLNKHIDDNIEKLANKTKGLQSPSKTIPNKTRVIKEIRIAQVLKDTCNPLISGFITIVPILNILLLLTLVILLLGQYISLREHVYPLVRKLFLYETDQDIYWWQRWEFTEKIIWTLLEYIQDKE